MLQDVMENAEGLLKFVLKDLMLGMKGFSNVSLTTQIREIIDKPFVRLAYSEAIDLVQKVLFEPPTIFYSLTAHHEIEREVF
eukprot:763972-Hanusia_phi.AAC.1